MRKKTFYAFISILIVLALVYVALSAFYFKDYNFLKWQIPASASSSEEKESEQTSNGAISVIEENGISVCKSLVPVANYSALGISEDVEAAYTLNLTVQPENATKQNIIYSLAFGGNPSVPYLQDWYSGKVVTDYLRVVPQSDGKTFLIECLQPFGARGILKFSLEDNSEVYSVCYFDYSKKAVGVDTFYLHLKDSNSKYGNADYKFECPDGYVSPDYFSVTPQSTANKFVLDLSKDSDGLDFVVPTRYDFINSFTCNPSFSPYTVDDTFESGNIIDSSAYGRGCQSVVDLAEEVGIHGVKIKDVEGNPVFGEYHGIPVGLKSLETYYDWGGSSAAEFIKKIADERSDVTTLTAVTIVCPFMSTYKSEIFELDLKLNIQAFYIPGTSIELSAESYTF